MEYGKPSGSLAGAKYPKIKLKLAVIDIGGSEKHDSLVLKRFDFFHTKTNSDLRYSVVSQHGEKAVVA